MNVMVVDNDRDSASSLAMLLSFYGHETKTAFCGKQAISELSDFEPDAAILDLSMPEQDGFETCRQLRELLGRGPIIVAYTGRGDPAYIQAAWQAGFDYFITKPAGPEVFDHALRREAITVGRAMGLRLRNERRAADGLKALTSPSTDSTGRQSSASPGLASRLAGWTGAMAT